MDSNEPNGAKLFAKMARIMGKLKRMSKGGTNQHFNYKFVTDADVADTIRELLAEENIAFFAEIVNSTQSTYEKTSSRGARFVRHSLIEFTFTFACGDTGATMTRHWQAEAEDDADKGINKAATAAEKFFLLKTFVMSTGDERDDPDSDSHMNNKSQQKPAAQKPATNGKPAPQAFPDVAAKEKFVTHWQSTDNLSEDEIKGALNIEYFRDYAGTLAQAHKAVEGFLLSRVPFGAQK